MNIVKELRKKKGVQQKELAIAIGVAQPTVSEWEANKKDPSGDRLRNLAKYFEVDELVILGKCLSDADPGIVPKTEESRIISECVDRMPQEDREKALAIFKAAYANYFPKDEERIS